MKHTCFCALVCPPKFLVHYAVLYFSISNATQSHFSGRYKWKLFGLCAFYRTYVSSWHFILVIVLDKLHPTPAGLGGKYVYLVYGHLGDILLLHKNQKDEELLLSQVEPNLTVGAQVGFWGY